MELPKNFQEIYGKISFDLFNLDLSETKYTRQQLIKELNVFKEFMARFNCDSEKLLAILDHLNICDNELFEYTTFSTPYLVEEDAVYVEKEIKVNGLFKLRRVYYNIYIKSNTYVSLVLKKVAEIIVGMAFPYLLDAPFTFVKKRFKDNISKLPKSAYVRIDKINSSILYDNEITIYDLIKLYTDKDYKDSFVELPRYSVYSGSTDIYISIDEEKGYSLYVTFEQLLNKDWKGIEEREISGICLYDENNNLIPKTWFYGKQKDAPYFNNPIVKALKEILVE